MVVGIILRTTTSSRTQVYTNRHNAHVEIHLFLIVQLFISLHKTHAV